MESLELDPQVAMQLSRAVATRLRWFNRLRRRMELRGFPPVDPLYQSVRRCCDAVQELHVRAHYASCTSGVGRSRPPSAPAPRAGVRRPGLADDR